MKWKKPGKITKSWLERMGACNEEINVFRKLWPRGCTINKTNVIKALERGLNVYWLAEEVLKWEGAVTLSTWQRYYVGINKIDVAQDQAIKKAGDENYPPNGLGFETAVLKARKAARDKEAELFVWLWRKAKKEL